MSFKLKNIQSIYIVISHGFKVLSNNRETDKF